MNDKWLDRVIGLIFYGILAAMVLSIASGVTVTEAVWRIFSAKDRAEQRELYSIIGDQAVTRIATKHVEGTMVCLDTFNTENLLMDFEQVWVKTAEQPTDHHLRLNLSPRTGHELVDPFSNNGFDKSKPPKDCRLPSLELQPTLSAGTTLKQTAQCVREAPLSVLLNDMLTGQFNLRSNFESLTEEITVEQSYEVSCDLVIKDVNNCIPENYGSKFAWGLEPAHDFGSFTKYNYCDHPENGEFKKQVLDKWARHIEPTK